MELHYDSQEEEEEEEDDFQTHTHTHADGSGSAQSHDRRVIIHIGSYVLRVCVCGRVCVRMWGRRNIHHENFDSHHVSPFLPSPNHHTRTRTRTQPKNPYIYILEIYFSII